MIPPRPARLALLPSRAAALRAAERALAAGTLVHVSGGEGSGRTTFSTQLLAARGEAGRSLRRIVGSPALTGVPFAALAALGLGRPERGERRADPGFALSIARIAQVLRSTPHTLMIDDADYLDDASAGVIAQVFQSAQVSVGTPVPFEVILTGSSDPAHLPVGLQQLVFDHRRHHVQLAPLGLEDARALLDGLSRHPVNASTVNRLLNLSGGSAVHLRELAFEARAAGALEVVDGFETLRAGWQPGSERISTLLARRLGTHPRALREAVEFIAVLGELSEGAAAQLMTTETLDQALDAGLLVISESAPVLDIAQSFDGPGAEAVTRAGEALVRLGSGLVPELVLGGLGRSELRERATQIRALLPRASLTANARLHLTHHLRRLGVPMGPRQLREDAEVAALAGLSDTVIVLTDQLPPLNQASPHAPDAIALRFMRSDALAALGRADAALQVLAPLLDAGSSAAVLRAARLEFDGLDAPHSAVDRLTVHAETVPEAAALLALFDARRAIPVSIEALEAAWRDERVSPALRLRLLSYLAAEHVHRGDPEAGARIFATHAEGPIWKRAPSDARGELVQAMFFAMLGDGRSMGAFDHHFADIEWAHLALDHAAFFAGRGMIFLEAGDVAEAADLFSQSAALLSTRDPSRLAGFTAGLDSVAATMAGDLARAAAQYAKWTSSPALSGGLSRPEAERATLHTMLAVDGLAAARARFVALVAGAERAQRPHQLMRLLHDSWRLRLVDADDAQLGLPRLAKVAAGVQGALASLLGDYSDAFAEVSSGDVEAGARTVEQLVAAHLEAGRPLYAAEVAARGAELAQQAGDKARASRLLDLFTQAVRPLGDVNTPSLGRHRVDDDALSEREREVCRHAAAGLNNAAIAEELFLSPRTVEGHLQRAYAKLGATDRRQLIA